MMLGPMMQAVLEDRFRVKVHRETREAPAYALIVTGEGARRPKEVLVIDHVERPTAN